jgi:hypothetical protein
VILLVVFVTNIYQIKNDNKNKKITTPQLIYLQSQNAFFQLITSGYALGYISFVLFIRTFFDLNIIFDSRTLSPIFLPVCVLFLSIIIGLKTYRLAALAPFILVLLLSISELKGRIQINYFNGVELNDKGFKTRTIAQFLQRCPSTSLIAADYPWHQNLLFHTMVLWLPQYILYGSGLTNLNYHQQLLELSRRVDLIIIENIQNQIIQDIESLASFTEIYSGLDGKVYLSNNLSNTFCQ